MKHALNVRTVLTKLSLELGISISQIAKKAGVHQSTISRACYGNRLDIKTLRVFVCNLDSDAAYRIVFAHLQDDLVRCGIDPDSIKSRKNNKYHDDLSLIKHAYYNDPEIREILTTHANIIRRKLLSIQCDI